MNGEWKVLSLRCVSLGTKMTERDFTFSITRYGSLMRGITCLKMLYTQDRWLYFETDWGFT